MATISSIIAAFVAIFGIIQWRFEKIGGRRIELAEEILALFYEAQDVFIEIRHPVSTGDEAANRPKDDNEEPDIAQLRDTFYAPIARLTRHTDFFSKLRSLKYRAMAALGKDIEPQFTRIFEVRAEVITAASMLFRDIPGNRALFGMNNLGDDMRRNLREKIWDHSTAQREDDLRQKVSQAVSDVESICEPIIQFWTKPKIEQILRVMSKS